VYGVYGGVYREGSREVVYLGGRRYLWAEVSSLP